MANTHETIADIIAAKRRLAAEMGKALGNQHTSVEMLKDDADRIEAAHKREAGDAAKLREAIITIRDKAHEQYVNDNGIDTVWIQDVANAALAGPPRNCDRPECATTKAAQDVWRKEDGGKTAYYEWLLATATEKEGGAK